MKQIVSKITWNIQPGGEKKNPVQITHLDVFIPVSLLWFVAAMYYIHGFLKLFLGKAASYPLEKE